jgi:hypothetical protein
MKLYFTDRQVPELTGLDFYQRRFVREHAFDLYCKDHPGAWWKIRLGNGGAMLAGFISGSMSFMIFHLFWIRVLVMTAVFMVIIFLIQSFLTERLRPYFQRYIAEHRDAVARAV